MTIEKLAYESELGSKGHLSSIERGLVVITIQTLKTIAEGLGVHPSDLLVEPGKSVRESVIDRSRTVSGATLERWLGEAGNEAPVEPRGRRHGSR